MPRLPFWHPERVRRRIIFWRHGRTEWNSLGRFQGQTDIALDAVGQEQATRAAALLQALAPTRIISSDLQRAHDTGLALGALTGLEVAPDPRLRETYAGTWQGLTFAQIGEQFPEEQANWTAGRVDVRPGGGETRVEVSQRVTDAVLEAAQGLEPDGTLVVATHGGAARVGIAQLLDLPHDHWSVLSGLANCNWSILEEIERTAAHDAVRWRLSEHNAGTLPQPVTVQEG